MAPPGNSKTTADELTKAYADDIKGKIILTTGVSPKSIGSTFVQSIAAAKPSLLILAGRNTAKIQTTADEITSANPDVKVRLLTLDLGSLAQVREAAAEVNSWEDVPNIDVLVNNAGIMAVPYKLSAEGYESQFSTNHLGHFLFTNLIMDKLLKSNEKGWTPRVVSVASDAHRFSGIRWADINFSNGETYNRFLAYGQSKTANMLFALWLAEKMGDKLLAYSLHPGVILTALADHLDHSEDFKQVFALDRQLGNAEGFATEFPWKSHQEGSATHVYAAFEPSLKEHNGVYLQDAHIADPWTETVRPQGTSKIEAERLWYLSEKAVGQEFKY